MISALLFPRVVKEQVKQLEAKGDLNVNATNNMKYFFFREILIACILIVFSAVAGLHSIFIILSLFLLSLAVAKFSLNRVVKKFYIPYIYNVSKNLIMTDCRYDYVGRAQLFFEDNAGSKYSTYILNNLPKSGKLEIEGKQNHVKCYLYYEDSEKCIPDIAVWRARHCLSKSLADGVSE